MAKKKKEQTVKTNAMRHLEDLQIPYTPHQISLEDAVDGNTVAALLGKEPDQVFKTLVTVGNDHNHYVFIIPASGHLSLKKAARAAGVKSVEMIRQKELFPLTGYVHGGCSPLGMKKEFPAFVDETVDLFDTFFFSGGKIGVQIELAPSFLDTLHIKRADLTE